MRAFAALAILTVISFAAAWAEPPSDAAAALERLLIESADSPEEQRALARYFRGKAERTRAAADHHRALLEAYAADHTGDAGDALIREAQKRHCAELASLYQKLAAEYEGLARGHEESARSQSRRR